MHDLVVKHTRLMCRNPLLSVPVSYAGSSLAPDGQPLRGIFDDSSMQVLGDNNQFNSSAHQVLEIPTVDVPTLARSQPITIDARAFVVRDFNPVNDGATTQIIVVPA